MTFEWASAEDVRALAVNGLFATRSPLSPKTAPCFALPDAIPCARRKPEGRIMAWYAYCITEQTSLGARFRRPLPIENLKGLGGTPVFAYPSGEFAVIVSPYVRDGQLQQTAILDHARVVSECFRTATVLPFKFGTIFDTDEALRRSVRS